MGTTNFLWEDLILLFFVGIFLIDGSKSYGPPLTDRLNYIP